MRRFALLAVCAVPFSTPADAASQRERRAMHRCDQQHVRACILRAALHRNVSYPWLKATAWCESRFNAYAVNGQYLGLFQYGPVWYSLPYRDKPRTSAKWSSLGAALMFSRGQSSQWACA